MIDIQLFRADKGGNPELIRESQRRRYADPAVVDLVIAKDNAWRRQRQIVDDYNKFVNAVSKVIGIKSRNKEASGAEEEAPQEIVDLFAPAQFEQQNADPKKQLEEASTKLTINQLKSLSKKISEFRVESEKKEQILIKERDEILKEVGNIVHDTVVVSDNEDNNGIERIVEYSPAVVEHQQKFMASGKKFLNHVDIMTAMGAMHIAEGTLTAGSRGYYLSGPLVLLNLAVIQYAIEFMHKKTYTPIYPPFFMRRPMMGKVAQLAEFDETLYKIPGDNSTSEEDEPKIDDPELADAKATDANDKDMYLIATSEQPICAFQYKKRFQDSQLPIRYVGYSSCFRKEAGSHGRDTLGIFRVHQFEKIEQFCITNPEDSWKMMDEMIHNSEEFYQSLGFKYRVVNIVSGKLNNAAAKKWDLEAYFPASQTYRELVSCSNCTDYQSRRLDVRYEGSKKAGGLEKPYVHMLNSTLSATSRTMCCICENYQVEDGVVIPEVLRKYMCGMEKIPFMTDPHAPQKKKK